MKRAFGEVEYTLLAAFSDGEVDGSRRLAARVELVLFYDELEGNQRCARIQVTSQGLEHTFLMLARPRPERASSDRVTIAV